MIKLNGCLAGCFGMGMLLMACDPSTSPGTTSTPTDADLIGTWNVTSIHTKGWMNDDSGDKQTIDNVDPVPSGSYSFEYKSDKTVSTTIDGGSQAGTWSLKGDSVLIIYSFSGFSDTVSSLVAIKGKSGTFTTHQVDPDDDFTVTLSATKQ